MLWARRLPAQQERADCTKALRLIFAQVKVFLVALQQRDFAVAIQLTQQYRLPLPGLIYANPGLYASARFRFSIASSISAVFL